jgi:hypothetical protein
MIVVPVNAGQPVGRANRAAFGQSRNDGDLLITRKDLHQSVPLLSGDRTLCIDESLDFAYISLAGRSRGLAPEWFA